MKGGLKFTVTLNASDYCAIRLSGDGLSGLTIRLMD